MTRANQLMGYVPNQFFLHTRNWNKYLVFVPGSAVFFEADGYELLALQFITAQPGISVDELVQLYSGYFRNVRPDAVFSILSELERISLIRPVRAGDGPSSRSRPLDASRVREILYQMDEMGASDEKSYCQHPLFVSIDVTDNCNLFCKHCRTNASPFKRTFLPAEVILNLLEELHGMQVFSIQFSGGEPLMRKDMCTILRYARKINGDWLLKIATNGTLVTDEIAGLLKDVRVDTVSVSIDGLGGVHDRFREHDSSFSLAIKGIKRLVARDLYVLVNTVIHRGNVDHLEELIRFIHDEINPSGHRLGIIYPAGRGETAHHEFFSMPERQDIWDRYLRIKEQYPAVVMRMPFLDYPGTIESTGYRYLDGCVAGKSYCAIQACGDVSPCTLALDHVAGNIHHQSLADIWSGDGFKLFREFGKESVTDPKCRNCK